MKHINLTPAIMLIMSPWTMWARDNHHGHAHTHIHVDQSGEQGMVLCRKAAATESPSQHTKPARQQELQNEALGSPGGP